MKETNFAKLNHLNLTVTDVPSAKHFLEKYFGMKTVGEETEVKYPTTFHIGFSQESEEQVNEINQR